MDVIERFLTSAVREILEKIMGRKTVPYEYYIGLNVIEPDDLSSVIEVLLANGRLADAEDLLFSQYEKSPSAELFEIGSDCFLRMQRLSDEQLAMCEFPREEVMKSQSDWAALKK